MKFIKAEFEKNFEQWSKSAFRTTAVITNAVGRGFNSDKVLQKLKAKINWSRLNSESWVMVVNDFDFTLTKMFYDRGITNIVFMTTAALSDKEVNNYFFDIIYKRPKFLNYFKDGKLPWKAILSMEEVSTPILRGKKIKWKTTIDIKLLTGEFMQSKEINLVIANPPYGAIGANITYTIIDKVNYNQFINLLPANDYKRNTTKDLFNFQSDMEPIKDAFKDMGATVTTHLANIHKTKVNTLTLEEFERSQYVDRQLDKYFEENGNRLATFSDIYLPSRAEVIACGPSTSVIFTKRDVNHKHLPYSKKVNSYKWNVEQSIDADYLIANTAVDFNNAVSIEMLIFKSPLEKDNFVSFIYSDVGFKFVSKLCTSVNVDSRFALDKLFPKVDWTRTWTVEEILADYNYTEDEIKAIIKDLSKFKGMVK